MNKRHPKRRRREIGIEDLLLQPWFLSRDTARKMRSLLPFHFRERLRDMFEEYGCLRCDRKNRPYRSNGMCGKCMMTVFHRLRTAANHRSKQRQAERFGKDFVLKEQAAQRLLREFSGLGIKRRLKFKKLIDLGSPVAAAFETFG